MIGICSGNLLAQTSPCGASVVLEQEPFDPLTQTIKVNVVINFNNPPGFPVYNIPVSNFNCLVTSNASSSPNNTFMQMTGGTNVVVANQPTTINNGQANCTFNAAMNLSTNGTRLKVGTIILNTAGACGSKLVFWVASCTASFTGIPCTFTITQPGPPNSNFLVIKAPDCIVSISGQVKTPIACGSFNKGFKDVDIEITKGGTAQCPTPIQTNTGGLYSSCALGANNTYSVKASKSCGKGNISCVTTNDLVLVQRHILSNPKLTEKWALLAANVNTQNNNITSADLTALQSLILNGGSSTSNSTTLSNNDCFRVISEDEYMNLNPLGYAYTPGISNQITVPIVQSSANNTNFIGIVVGDVNGSCYCSGILNTPNELGEDIAFNTAVNESTNSKQLILSLPNNQKYEIIQFDLVLSDGFDLTDIKSNLPTFSKDDYRFDKELNTLHFLWVKKDNLENKDVSYFIQVLGKNGVEHLEYEIGSENIILTNDGLTHQVKLSNPEFSMPNINLEQVSEIFTEIFVFDSVGRLILSDKSNGINDILGKLQANNENGLYIIQAKSNSGMKTFKFAVQK